MIVFACVLFTAALLGYVLSVGDMSAVSRSPEKSRLTFLRERKEVLYENLRDLNFEHKAGKLPDGDYESMRQLLEEEAAALLSEISALELDETKAHHREH